MCSPVRRSSIVTCHACMADHARRTSRTPSYGVRATRAAKVYARSSSMCHLTPLRIYEPQFSLSSSSEGRPCQVAYHLNHRYVN